VNLHFLFESVLLALSVKNNENVNKFDDIDVPSLGQSEFLVCPLYFCVIQFASSSEGVVKVATYEYILSANQYIYVYIINKCVLNLQKMGSLYQHLYPKIGASPLYRVKLLSNKGFIIIKRTNFTALFKRSSEAELLSEKCPILIVWFGPVSLKFMLLEL
jgi:hypothetical protein